MTDVARIHLGAVCYSTVAGESFIVTVDKFHWTELKDTSQKLAPSAQSAAYLPGSIDRDLGENDNTPGAGY